MREEARRIMVENRRRQGRLNDTFNPVTGEGSILEREVLQVDDFELPTQYVPTSMYDIELVRQIAYYGSMEKYVVDHLHPLPEQRGPLVRLTAELLERIRQQHDFGYWCAVYSTIQNKEGGSEVPLVMNFPQRRLAAEYERQRLENIPIRLDLLKARQWGGSTLTQLYMAWIQICLKMGLNSIIVAQVLDSSRRIKAMFTRLLMNYPTHLLYDIGMRYNPRDPKFSSLHGSTVENVIPQRNCSVSIGTAEKPDSVRSGAYALAHLSEVAMWKETDGKKPQDIVRSATSGILYRPYTMIVYESTANGMNFFHDEWKAAVSGASQFVPFFVPWYQIELYQLPVGNYDTFISTLLAGREGKAVENDHQEPGQYLWWLWRQGATLEHIAWYIEERKKFDSHADMAAEYPTDDIEAFKHSGNTVFAKENVDKMDKYCKPPTFRGEIAGNAVAGPESLAGLRFAEESNGRLWIWEMPEPDEDGEIITNRYITVVDVGRGLTDKADNSVIVTIDRLGLLDEGGLPVVVAQWVGHIDMDLLAWKAAQQAKWYNNSLLVIESNTYETNGGVAITIQDGNTFALEVIAAHYDNLYQRDPSAERVKQGLPGLYGFHTNAKTKNDIIDNLIAIIREGGYIERDKATLDEYYLYIRNEHGVLTAPPGKHDDRLITRAIAMWVSSRKMPKPAIVHKSDYAHFTQRSISEATI